MLNYQSFGHLLYLVNRATFRTTCALKRRACRKLRLTVVAKRAEGRNRSFIGQKGSRAEDTTAAIERFATSSVRKVGRTSDGTMKLSRKINRCPKSLSAIGHQCPYISAVKSGPFLRSRYIKKLNDIETDISVGEDGSYSLGRRGANFSSGEVACTFRGKCSYFLTALVILSFGTKIKLN